MVIFISRILSRGIPHVTPIFIMCGGLSEKTWIIFCCTGYTWCTFHIRSCGQKCSVWDTCLVNVSAHWVIENCWDKFYELKVLLYAALKKKSYKLEFAMIQFLGAGEAVIPLVFFLSLPYLWPFYTLSLVSNWKWEGIFEVQKISTI